MSLRAPEILELVEQRNARVIARRREYYEYLVSRGDQKQTLEEHLEQYAEIVRTGEAATASEIRSLEDAIGRPRRRGKAAFRAPMTRTDLRRAARLTTGRGRAYPS
jgi:glycine/D-amino acid oxidase-like deaminating enzyme